MDYGPVYSFWCFSYERYNGILGNQPNNNRNIESQLMHRFLVDNFAFSFVCPNSFYEDFNPVCSLSSRLTGSVLQTMNPEFSAGIANLPKRYTRAVLDCTEQETAIPLLAKLKACQSSAIKLNSIVTQYKSININGEQLSAHKYHSSIVMLRWDSKLFEESPSSLPESLTISSQIIRPASIVRFIKVTYSVCSDIACSMDSNYINSIVFACVTWHLPHSAFSNLGKPAQIWCKSLYEVSGIHSFVPLNLFKSRCIHCSMLHDGENVIVVVPLVN